MKLKLRANTLRSSIEKGSLKQLLDLLVAAAAVVLKLFFLYEAMILIVVAVVLLLLYTLTSYTISFLTVTRSGKVERDMTRATSLLTHRG